MEYLEMRGEVRLKSDCDLKVVNRVLRTLRETPFEDTGYVDIQRQDSLLSIYAEGTVSESYSLRALLSELQNQLFASSMIGVSRVRWETLIVLKHIEPASVLRLEPIDTLVFAQ